VLDPSGARIDLAVLDLMRRDHMAAPVEQKAARARRPLIDGGNDLGFHQKLLDYNILQPNSGQAQKPGSS
jgi:hypothetical protein